MRRAAIAREVLGPDARVMADVNQQWPLAKALAAWERLKSVGLTWLEEPTQPDDVNAHARLVAAKLVGSLAHAPLRHCFAIWRSHAFCEPHEWYIAIGRCVSA